MLWTVDSLRLIVIASLESLLHKRWQSHSNHVTAFGLPFLRPRGHLSLLIAIHFTCNENRATHTLVEHRSWNLELFKMVQIMTYRAKMRKHRGNIEQGRANHRTGCTTCAKIRIACSSLSKSLLHICWIDVFLTRACGMTSRSINSLHPWVHCPLDAMFCYIVGYCRVSTGRCTKCSLKLLQQGIRNFRCCAPSSPYISYAKRHEKARTNSSLLNL